MISASGVEQSVLELRPSYRVPGAFALLLALYGPEAVLDVVWPQDRSEFVSGCIGCAVSAVVLVAILVTLVSTVRARAAGWWVRLDAVGVTARGRKTVPWSDLREVRLSRPPRGWRSLQMVAFVPRPGVQLPTVPEIIWPLSRLRSRAASLTRRCGSPMVVNPFVVGIPADRIAAVAQRLSGLPVVRP